MGNRKKLNVNTVYDLVRTDEPDFTYRTKMRYCGMKCVYSNDVETFELPKYYYYFNSVIGEFGDTIVEISEDQMNLLSVFELDESTFTED
jgi:hypothetical protein